MANTRDLIGDQAALDGLVERTLTSLEESKVTKLAAYALYANNAIEDVTFPALTEIEPNTFANCSALKTVSAPNLTKIGYNAFSQCGALSSVGSLSSVENIGSSAFQATGIGQLVLPACTSIGAYVAQTSYRLGLVDLTKRVDLGNAMYYAHSLASVILRSPTLCPCSSFSGTPFENGIGYIYVPSDLVDSYKSATNWSAYASQIVPISEYPKALQDETITDTWEQIFAAESDGTYSEKYNVGGVKYLYLGGTPVAMQIVAMDTDVLSAGGNAKITWISKGGFDSQQMNPTNSVSGGWLYSDLRTWLRSDVWNLIDSSIRSNIKEVSKTYYDYDTRSTLSTSDTLWIPSYREMFGGTSWENNGVDYTSFFTDNTSRIKMKGLSSISDYWWLRSVDSATRFRTVSNSGSSSSVDVVGRYGVALGFCT